MRIYSMTATFGKLEHETLTLQPGLNIIEAPNEWGKSTWCAFLVTMLYGIDTRAKTTKVQLADKERYAPWSGSPMSGRIDLNWNGRDITIERSSKGRSPMGIFRAYETATGLEIPELTAANCGQTLLGVERSVFTRAGFLRFTDLPVTQDDALRHRLNALVTTGDESGAAEALGQKLKDLKNRCRYNRSGLLPQAEAEQAQLARKLADLDDLSTQSQRLSNRSQEVAQWIAELENHKAALQFAAAQDNAQRVNDAADSHHTALAQYQQAEADCANIPDLQTAEKAIQALEALQREQESLQLEERLLPDPPTVPEVPTPFSGMTPEDAIVQAQTDSVAYAGLEQPKKPAAALLMTLSLLLVSTGVALLVLKLWGLAIPALVSGAAMIVAVFVLKRNYNRHIDQLNQQSENLRRRYGNSDPAEWLAAARSYEAAWKHYQAQLNLFQAQQGDLESRRSALNQRLETLSTGRNLSDWHAVQTAWSTLGDCRRALQQAEHHYRTLQSMLRPVQPPVAPDTMTYTEAETNRLLSDAQFEQRQLHQRLGQCQGQMDTLGNRDALQRDLDTVQKRIETLEQTYAALEHAQAALTAARQELQRRFAPRITQQAQELFAQLTGGRYNRLMLGEDLSVQAGAQDENTLRSHQWRSDGTIDQVYLALRLAVAKELTPDAPLVLDDALVRFDDRRLATALEILRQEAEHKQVLLFTCQGREKTL